VSAGYSTRATRSAATLTHSASTGRHWAFRHLWTARCEFRCSATQTLRCPPCSTHWARASLRSVAWCGRGRRGSTRYLDARQRAASETPVRAAGSRCAIPFVAQDAYDRLLWSCDVNFVRGEDSFVRAQWASRAFAWHIYPQAEGAHWRKLDAFLDRYATGLDSASEDAVRRFWRAWNGAPDARAIADAWLEFAAARPHLERHGGAWAAKLAALPDLAFGLVKAARGRV
jgi:uncharacterized repeat protein (TIGR03837 family)